MCDCYQTGKDVERINQILAHHERVLDSILAALDSTSPPDVRQPRIPQPPKPQQPNSQRVQKTKDIPDKLT